MVIDLRSVTQALPHSIEAFFYVSSGGPDQLAFAREAQHSFVEYYGLDRTYAPPLLRLEMEGNSEGRGGAIVGDRPFLLHPG